MEVPRRYAFCSLLGMQASLQAYRRISDYPSYRHWCSWERMLAKGCCCGALQDNKKLSSLLLLKARTVQQARFCMKVSLLPCHIGPIQDRIFLSDYNLRIWDSLARPIADRHWPSFASCVRYDKIMSY